MPDALDRAEDAARQAEANDPRNPGTHAMWTRALTYAVLTSIEAGGAYRSVRWEPGAPTNG